MNKPNVRWRMIGLAALILIVIAAIVFWIVWISGTSAPSSQSASGASSTITTVTNGTPGGTSTASTYPPSSSGDQSAPAPVGSTITIHLLTPISNNLWTIGQANPIAWDNAADVTGEIDLVNATTKQFIGVILAQTGPKQTSYTWNADQVYLGRFSADEKAVIPGIYSIRIHFDGNALGDLVSGPFTISN